MKIATFNVNGITSRLPRLLEWLEESSPDIACLQELKTQMLRSRTRDQGAGYGAIWHGQKGFNGVAILAKDAQPARDGADCRTTLTTLTAGIWNVGQRHHRRIDLSAERKSTTGAEV